jgi:hypothetical protein
VKIAYPVEGEDLVVRRVLNAQVKKDDVVRKRKTSFILNVITKVRYLV